MSELAYQNIRGVDCTLNIFDVDENSGNETVQIVLELWENNQYIWDGTIEAFEAEGHEIEMDAATNIFILKWLESLVDKIDDEIDKLI